MAEQSSSLNEIQALHSDLLALSNSRLSNLERLAIELDAHIAAFRNLLNHKSRNEQSRKSIEEGKVERDGQMYKINDDFKQGTYQLADELNLDEFEASQIFFDAQDDADATGRSILSCSIIRFHQRRKLLLDCLRLTLQQNAELESDSEQERELKAYLEHIITESTRSEPTTTTKNGAATSIKTSNAPTFISRCISTMGDIRHWLQKISDKVSSLSVLGQPSQPDLLEIMEYQRHSLVKQHELLGVIILYLIKANHSVEGDFELLLGILKKADKYDNLLVHHFPALAAYIWRYGSPEGGSTIQDARALDKKISVKTDQNAWVLPYAHAAFRAWWLAEYSGWYVEHHDGLPHGINLEDEAKQRSQQFNEALKDGAFDFMLSLSADVKAATWSEPSRQGFRLWLQRKAPQLLSDSVSFSDFFENQFMEQLQTFIESFITNLPDVLRRLRIDEDEQRQLSHEHEHDLDLERFIVIISYAFDGRPKAALEGFWDVPDGVLIGFMYWASRRASTPLVSAFCEMLQAISGDDECATAAHEFLLDESPQAGKMKRAHALTWNQIFKELTFFTNKLRDQPVPQAQAYRHGKPNHDQAELEPESYIMLESYLRLISQLSGEYLWTALDIWTSGGYVHNPSTQRNTAPPSYAPDAILRKFATGFEEPDAFILLLHALVLPYEEDSALRDGLPFPELLGASSRMPGIDPYVDFAVGQVFGSRMIDTAIKTHRRTPVPNAAYASFEDGVLNHLTIIPDLGLYCSSGNPELVMASLKLLEKLSASPQLAAAPKAGSRRIDRNKAIAALEENNAAEAISRSLLQEIEASIDEAQGPASDSPGLLWDDRDLADPEFLDSTSASCLSNFLNQRAIVLQYTSAELRRIALSHLPSLKERMFNTLLGSTMVEENQQIDNCSVFDLFDFMDIPLDQSIALGSLSWLKDIDISVCEEVHNDSPPLCNMVKLEELLTLRRSELAATKRLENPQDVTTFKNEAQLMFNYYFIDNKLKELQAARHKALQSWVQLLLVMVETMAYDESTKIVFVLQTLQIILPRLENCLENAADAFELAKLTKALLFSLNLDSDAFKEGDLGQNLSDKLFHVFELSLRAINAVGANGPLKELFYTISYHYLTGTSESEIHVSSEIDNPNNLDGGSNRARPGDRAPASAPSRPGLRKPHSTQTVKLAGDRVIDIVCDDVLVGEQNCRIAALLLLGALVKNSKQENSNYIIESLNRLNFISILVHSIGDLGNALQETSREDAAIILSDFYARLALLVHISQTRAGATAVLNSGLFHSILVSGLFSIDTDLEIDFNDSEAVSRHYSLLAAIMRVICCALVSRGLQNEQSLDQGRRFLADNRAAILAVLKKSAGLGTGNDSAEQSIVDISDSFMLLMTITRFVDFEEITIQKRPTLRSFT
ncbi:hypothetical protein SS1G_03225 [Sclerotinia sclerotiorum 1980 UF-70]|uniref:Uncharacterized protein n=1 Tax=Sclerotinia sclerotiorum (strain ATCC 18683 / 1980 / Ss-1) TaxID=665079 RepID=A7ED36_SCLS1|nr:hypothetical protein SS1G_03225 [Sclerotinia sclerotiorum 1980 UF-70]EDO00752.1 hypothetical protein SS1G_03225 [Sclerotinia sclerotiorum 1980 UF-70]